MCLLFPETPIRYPTKTFNGTYPNQLFVHNCGQIIRYSWDTVGQQGKEKMYVYGRSNEAEGETSPVQGTTRLALEGSSIFNHNTGEWQ
jgi:hypothetical protein